MDTGAGKSPGIRRDIEANRDTASPSRIPDEAQFSNRIGYAEERDRRLSLDSIDDLRTITTYHQPDVDQVKAHQNVRAAAQAYAEAILNNVPAGTDRHNAIQNVRASLFFANAAIALRGRV